MKTLLFFAFRNILRQKRRAFLLGTAMALGTCFLVMASSFVAGISQTLFERVMVYVAGHASVIVFDRGYLYRTALRGGMDLKRQVAAIPHVRKVEETVGVMCRMIGATKADNAFMIGLDLSQKYTEAELQEIKDNFPMVAGNFDDLKRTDVENPAVISRSKAEFLGLKVGDALSSRFQDSRGRMQVAKLHLVGIFEPSNVFMEAPLFISLSDARRLMDLGPGDMPYLYLTVEDPQRNAVAVADSLQKLFTSRLAALPVEFRKGGISVPAVAAGVKSDSVSRVRLGIELKLSAEWKGEVVVLPEPLATRLGARPLDTVLVASGTGRSGDPMVDKAVVAGIWQPPPGSEGLALWEEDAFHRARSFRSRLPGDTGRALVEAAAKRLDTLLSPEWALTPRAKTTDDVADQYRMIGGRKWKSPVVAVRTMYEMGEQIVKLADVLNIITVVAVLILFLVVLTGVVNTLRMTVRERTREIGTLRSLGMQASEVRRLFLLETTLLALFSALAGTALAGAAMFGLSRITISAADNPLSMLLVRGHLVFVPGAAAIAVQILLVVGMAVAAAWFPAGWAAKLPPANALRHHE